MDGNIYFRTKEELLARHPKTQVLYGTGEDVNIGDTVEYDQRLTGTVRALAYSGGTLYLGIDIGEGFKGNNLEGVINTYTGTWADIKHCQLVNSAASEPEDDVALLRKALEKTPSVALINGNYFALTPVPAPEPNVLINPIVDGMAKKLKMMRDKAARQVAEERRKAENTLNMPELSRADLISGIRVCKDKENLLYLMPFKFAPKIIGEEHPSYNGTPKDPRQISEAHQAKLAKDLTFALWVDRTGYTTNAALIKDEATWAAFRHYHGECWGTMKRATIYTVKDAVSFRNRYQKMLEWINTSRLHDGQDKSLLAIVTIIKDATPIDPTKSWTDKVGEEAPKKESGGVVSEWTTKQNDAPEDKGDGMFKVGDVVRVKNRDNPKYGLWMNDTPEHPMSYILRQYHKEYEGWACDGEQGEDCRGYIYAVEDIEPLPLTEDELKAGDHVRLNPEVVKRLGKPYFGWSEKGNDVDLRAVGVVTAVRDNVTINFPHYAGFASCFEELIKVVEG